METLRFVYIFLIETLIARLIDDLFEVSTTKKVTKISRYLQMPAYFRGDIFMLVLTVELSNNRRVIVGY
jgi:hypothetical protein